MASTLPTRLWVTCWISLELETEPSINSSPSALQASFAIFIWKMEFCSLEQYISPTFFASGTTFLRSLICWETGVRSEVPVTFVSGFALDFTSFADSGSVTAEISTGISFVRFATAWAAGVAMAKIKSSLSFTSLLAIVTQFPWSPWALCMSMAIFLPSV